MRPIYLAYIAVLLAFGGYFFAGQKENNDFSIAMAPPLISKPETPSRASAPKPTPSLGPARKPASAFANSRGALEVEKFLENSSHIQSLVTRDLQQLAREVVALQIPDGKIVREKGRAGVETSYREMKTDWGAEIKKIATKDRTISESYRSASGEQFIERAFSKEGQVRTVVVRWSGKEAVMVDYYSNGQVSGLNEAANGENTSQKWDLDGNLIHHTTTGVYDGKFQHVDHLNNSTTSPADTENKAEE